MGFRMIARTRAILRLAPIQPRGRLDWRTERDTRTVIYGRLEGKVGVAAPRVGTAAVAALCVGVVTVA